MPRKDEPRFCGRCSHLLAAEGRKRARVGERLGVATVDYGMACTVCVDRHGLGVASAGEPAPVPVPSAPEVTAVEPAEPPAPVQAVEAPAPAPVAVDAAQAALDALPSWIREDGARHGRTRLELAAAELSEKAPRPAPEPAKPTRPTKAGSRDGLLTVAEAAARLEVTRGTVYRWMDAVDPIEPMHVGAGGKKYYSLDQIVEVRARAAAPAPVARDDKDSPKGARPVRRPAKPRRAGASNNEKATARAARLDELHRLLSAGTPRDEAVTTAGYASLGSARGAVRQSGRGDLIELLRVRDHATSKPEQKPDRPQVSKDWSAEMPGPARPEGPPRPARTRPAETFTAIVVPVPPTSWVPASRKPDPAPRPAKQWAERTSAPRVVRPSVAEKFGQEQTPPAKAAEILRRRREVIEAYHARHGTDMLPPAVRSRPIVTPKEIAATLETIPDNDDGTVESFHPDVCLNPWEAARYLGVHASTLNMWRSRGEGPAWEKGDRRVLYRVADLDEFKEARQRPAPTTEAKAEQRPPAPKPAPPAAVASSRPGDLKKRSQRAARLDAMERALAYGADVKDAAAEAGFSNVASARAAAHVAGRQALYTAILEAGKKAMAENARAVAAARRQRGHERMDRLAQLLRDGVPLEDATGREGFKTVHAARAGARNLVRDDVLELLRSDRKTDEQASDAPAAQGRAA